MLAFAPGARMQCINHPDVDQEIVRCLRCQQPFCPDCVVMLGGYWYCGPCKDERVRDIQSGTGGVFELASPGRRLAAALLDSLIQGAAMMVIIIPFFFVLGGAAAAAGASGSNSEAASAALGLSIVGLYGLMFFLSMALPLVYEALMLARRGQTLGKMAVSIQVVGTDGGSLSRGQAWGRSAMKVALGQACSCFGLLADMLPLFFTVEKTALHDMAAGTRVVRLR